MILKRRVSASVGRPLLMVFTVNTIAAICIQGVFVILLFGPFLQTWQVTGLSKDGYTLTITATALLLACSFTAAAIVAMESIVKIMPSFGPTKILNREISRAVYFSIIGMIGFCATKAAEANRTLPAVIFIAIVAGLLFLGSCNEKCREARQDIFWFPIFQYGLQRFMLFPIGLWIASQILHR
ncbi:MAG: hypothetical protein KGJ13_03890 [Patescibacteria group bacterium]|nr:hypothetical protein [Patescibacteria group bacterium]